MLAVRLPASFFLIQHDALHFSFEWLTGAIFTKCCLPPKENLREDFVLEPSHDHSDCTFA